MVTGSRFATASLPLVDRLAGEEKDAGLEHCVSNRCFLDHSHFVPLEIVPDAVSRLTPFLAPRIFRAILPWRRAIVVHRLPAIVFGRCQSQTGLELRSAR